MKKLPTIIFERDRETRAIVRAWIREGGPRAKRDRIGIMQAQAMIATNEAVDVDAPKAAS